MVLKLSGFDWDRGNLEKCQKHGVSRGEIENLFSGFVMMRPDVAHSQAEQRFQAIGEGKSGRRVFLVFTIRTRDGQNLVRPISARYMRRKEIASYEKEDSSL
jgi:uncharacterized protein